MPQKYSSAKKKVKRRRRLAFDTVSIVDVDESGAGKGTGPKHSGGRIHMATVANHLALSGMIASRSPAGGIAKAIRDALDPVKAPGKCKTFAEMTPEERDEMERLYGEGPRKSKA